MLCGQSCPAGKGAQFNRVDATALRDFSSAAEKDLCHLAHQSCHSFCLFPESGHTDDSLCNLDLVVFIVPYVLFSFIT